MLPYSEIENISNEEAVAYFGTLTRNAIPCGDLENLLDWSGLAKRHPVTSAWEGDLIDFMVSDAVPALCEGLKELFSHLNKSRSITVDTTTQPWAGKLNALCEGLVAAGQMNQSVCDDVMTLAGGLAYEGLDVAAVQAVRDQHAADLAETAEFEARSAALIAWRTKWDSLMNIHVNPLQDANDFSDASTIAALQAMASDWSN